MARKFAELRAKMSPDSRARAETMKRQLLDGEEFGMFRALWHGTQDNGPHAGLTDAEEARFRMHSATAAGRYLVKKVA